MAFVTFIFLKPEQKEKIEEVFSGTTLGGAGANQKLQPWMQMVLREQATKLVAKQCQKIKAFKVVDILADSGIRQISITGGEPTLVTYLPELVERITSRGMIANPKY